jgi:hypothetical protein
MAWLKNGLSYLSQTTKEEMCKGCQEAYRNKIEPEEKTQ